jgi:hypothetical protein
LFRKFFVFHGWHPITNSNFSPTIAFSNIFKHLLAHERTTHETSN